MQICAYLFSTLPHLYQTCATATPPLILCNHRHLCQIRVTTAPLSKPCHRCTFANPLRPPHLRQTFVGTLESSQICFATPLLGSIETDLNEFLGFDGYFANLNGELMSVFVCVCVCVFFSADLLVFGSYNAF